MKAIDVHCHVSTKTGMESIKTFNEAMERYYKVKTPIRTDEEMAQDFVNIGVKGMPVAWDAETNTGLPRTSNDYVAKLVKDHPEAFIGGWACVDPWKGEMAIQELERAIKVMKLNGVKFHPNVQGFFPNDKRFYPLYEKCLELKIPVQFHTGTTGIGAGMPGGMGIHLKYTQPIYLDDIAADFPDLTIIACHASWPWQEEMIAVLLHKGNVFNELSGWSPKYFSDSLKKEINGRLQDKMLFGSDYPSLQHERLFKDYEESGFKPEVLEKIYYKNAQRILNLSLE